MQTATHRLPAHARQPAATCCRGLNNFRGAKLSFRRSAASEDPGTISQAAENVAGDDAVSVTFRRGQGSTTPGRGAPSAATRQLEETWLEGRGRIGMMVMASKGTLDRAPSYVKREDTPGKLLTEIISWPSPFAFTVVGKAGPHPDRFAEDVVSTVAGVCGVASDAVQCSVTERMGGKFVSIRVMLVVPGPEAVAQVYDTLGKDPRVKMKF